MTGTMTLRPPDPRGLNRMLTLSFAAHALVVLSLFLMPRAWVTNEPAATEMMTVSLGSAGERTGGMNAAGAQQVEEVAPPPKRPAPLPVVPPKPETTIAVPRTPAKTPPPKGTDPSTEPPRPPVTGTQVTPGTARAYTGTTSQGTGLAVGGGAGGAEASVPANFCCPEYITELLRRIGMRWRKSQPEQGTTTIKFVINRDGTFSKPEVEVSSGSVLLDITSRDAFAGLRLDPLPKGYTEDQLTIHLKFPYVR